MVFGSEGILILIAGSLNISDHNLLLVLDVVVVVVFDDVTLVLALALELSATAAFFMASINASSSVSSTSKAHWLASSAASKVVNLQKATKILFIKLYVIKSL